MSILPYVTCVCPACFEEIYLGECRIMSGITSNKVLREARKGTRARMKVEPLTGHYYALELARRECPSCQYLLPPNIEQVPSIALVVIGDLSAGKSHYIAALIHQIKEDWLGNTTGFARMTCLTPIVEKKYTQDYFRQLFIGKKALAPTLQAVRGVRKDPLIYNLTVSPSPKHPATSINLMIYDTSGEDYINPLRLVELARFVFHTNALVFVADPFTMTALYYRLPDPPKTLLQPQFQQAQGSRAADKLNEIITVFEQFHGYPQGSTLPDTPVAVMVSKSDLFDFVVPQPGRFMQHPRYEYGINLRDVDAVDREVRGLLTTFGQNDLLSTTIRFKRMRFFATSATGEPPDASGTFTNVQPRRCLDPMLWILHQLDIIKGV